MKNPLRKWKMILLLISIAYILPQPVHAGWEWRNKKELNFPSPILDVSESSDGNWMFILTPGEVLVYSVPENRTQQHIPLDKAYDRLNHSPQNNTLTLTSRSEKTIKIIQLEMIHQMNLSDRPFLGAENAPVVLSVFFDYQ